MRNQGRLFASITAGVVISGAIIALVGSPMTLNFNLNGGSAFRIENIAFASRSLNSTSCGSSEGIVIITVQGLSGDSILNRVTIGDQGYLLNNTHTHGGETTTLILDFPWIQGFQYHVTVSSQSQETAVAESPFTPIKTANKVSVTELGIRGSVLWMTLVDEGQCDVYLTSFTVSGPLSPNSTYLLTAPMITKAQNSSSLRFELPFQTQQAAAYNVTLVIQGITYNFIISAPSNRTGGSIPTIHPN